MTLRDEIKNQEADVSTPVVLNKIANILCNIVNIPGPPINSNINISLQYIEQGLRALQNVTGGSTQPSILTLLTWLKWFMFKYITERIL